MPLVNHSFDEHTRTIKTDNCRREIHTLTTSIDTVSATSNALVDGTQATFQSFDSITATGTNNKLSLVDSGTAAWNLPAATVSGFQTVSVRNINGQPAATDNGTLTFQNVAVGGTIIIDGLTMTATNGTATAADIAAAFASGATVNNARITGSDGGAWTLSAGPSTNQVSFVSATPNTAVTPIAVTGTAQTGQQAVQTILVTYDASAGAAGDILSFSINGVTVRTAPLAADTVVAAGQAIAAAINGYLGSTTATSVVTAAGATQGQVTVTTANGIQIGAVSDVTNAGGVTNTVVATTQGAIQGGAVSISETAGNSGASFTDSWDADNFVGATEFISDRSTGAVSITDVNAGTAITMKGASSNVANGAITAAFDAGNSTITFNATGGTGTSTGRGAVTLTSAAATDLTTVNINSTGATNRVGTMTFNGQATAININANSAFDTSGIVVGTNTANQVITVSGSAANRGASATSAPTAAVVLGTLDSDIDSVNASGLTAGGVSLTIADTLATITGGAGSDYITTAATAQLAAVSGGAGTDVLIQANTNAIASLTAGNLFSGFEVYQANNGVALDMDLLATNNTIGAIRINDGAGTTAVTDLSSTQASDITVIAANGRADMQLKVATGTADVMNILVSDLDLTSGETTTVDADWYIDNVETINITAFDNVDIASIANMNEVTTLNVRGAGGVDITTSTAALQSGLVVNYSGVTAASTIFNFSAATTNALSFVGSAGADTVTDSVVGGNVINTAGGQDTVTLTAKTGGTGPDIITGGALGDVIDLKNGSGSGAYGNATYQKITFQYANGDSVITGTVAGTGYDATVMDSVIDVDMANGASASAGSILTFDTLQAATSFTFTTTAPVFGTTAVTNAYDFLVFSPTGGSVYLYQDTNGNRIIESGEFGVKLVGVTSTSEAVAGEFAITTGNLVYTSASDA